MNGYDDRHPSTQHMMSMLKPNPNLEAVQEDIAMTFWDLSVDLTYNLKDSPELTAGLRKLLEAKDCFVRASLDLNSASYTDR